MELQCKNCKKTKTSDVFYQNDTYRIGFDTSRCKLCRLNWYSKNKKERCQQSKEDYLANREKRLKQIRKYNKHYYKNNKEKFLESTLKCREKYPEKDKARIKLRNAVARGKVKKLSCVVMVGSII